MKKRGIIIGLLAIGIIFIVGGLVFWRLRGGVRIKPAEDFRTGGHVIFYRQDDEAWAKDLLGDSSYTMKSSGCLVTCIASAISADGETVTPGELNDLLSENAVYDGEGNMQWAGLAELEGYHVTVYPDVSNADIEKCLEDDHYPIVRVRVGGIGNVHYVLIVGVKDGEYLCMDPLKDKLTKLSDYLGRVYAVRCVWKDSKPLEDGKGIIRVGGWDVEYTISDRELTVQDFENIEIGSSLQEIADELGDPDGWTGSGILRPFYVLKDGSAVELIFEVPGVCENLRRMLLCQGQTETVLKESN